MKKILFFLITTFLFSCKPNYTTNHLSDFIESTVKKNKGIIDLRFYNEKEWNKLYILGPYSYKKQFDNNLKKYEQQILKTDIEMLDDRCVLLLFNNNKLVDLSIIKRQIDFSAAAKLFNSKIGFYTKNTCLFHYKKGANGFFIIEKS